MIPGFVRVSVTGEQCERFLNLCRGRDMELRKIIRTGEKEFHVTLKVKDFWKISPLRRKTGVHIHILRKKGPVFWLLAANRHKLILAGLLTMVCVLIFLSGRLWNIHIEGNIMNPTPELLKFLEKEGIHYGMSKKKIRCTSLAEAMRRKYPDITWVSAKLSGTQLIFEIREGTTPPEEQTEETFCSLFSEVEGTVEKIITRRGTPLVKEGDSVEKGQELVSGILNITDDSQQVVRYEYVHADADIYIRHNVSYYDIFSLDLKKKVPDGKARRFFFLQIGNLRLDLSPGVRKNEERLIREYPARVTENFILPVLAGTVTVQKYALQKETFTEQAAKKQAVQRFYNYEEKLIQKGVQISENNVNIEINYQDCVSRGTLNVIEKTGREAPTEKKAQPKERTPEDG